jgi:hypothetical protein
LLGAPYHNGTNVPNDHKLYQMAIKFSIWPKNIPTFSIPSPSIIQVPKLGFWFENNVPGNPEFEEQHTDKNKHK